MTITSTTRSGAMSHALLALGTHLAEHPLPAPISIGLVWNETAVAVHVKGRDSRAWLDTLYTDHVRQSRDTPDALHVHYDCRLPDTGVRVELTVVQLDSASPALALVTGVSA